MNFRVDLFETIFYLFVIYRLLPIAFKVWEKVPFENRGVYLIIKKKQTVSIRQTQGGDRKSKISKSSLEIAFKICLNVSFEYRSTLIMLFQKKSGPRGPKFLKIQKFFIDWF